MTKVTRLQGKTFLGTYVVSVFIDGEKIDRIETSGRTPHKDVTETCEYFARNHAKLVGDSVKAIKLAMAKHGEYRGVVAEA